MHPVGKPGIYNQGYQSSVSAVNSTGEVNRSASIYFNKLVTEPYRFSLSASILLKGFSGRVVLRKN